MSRLGIPGATIGRIRSGYVKQLQKCNYCGGARHSDGSHPTRSKEGKAFGKTCTKCAKPDHFSSVCRQKTPTNKTAGVSEDPNASPDTINGALNFFGVKLQTPEYIHEQRCMRPAGSDLTRVPHPTVSGDNCQLCMLQQNQTSWANQR